MRQLPFDRLWTAPATWRRVKAASKRLVAFVERQGGRAESLRRVGTSYALLLSDGTAAWIVWRPTPQVGREDGLQAWECILFRNEGKRRTVDLIREATELTYRAWGWPPQDGLIAGVGIEQVAKRRAKRRLPGDCFLAAGWRSVRVGKGTEWLRAPPPVPLRRDRRDAA